MVNTIIILIAVVLLVFALKGSIRHFKGESSCCGGGSVPSYRPKQKKLDGPVRGRKTVKISGMRCRNCADSVTAALNEIEGVSAKVNLYKKNAEVFFDRAIDDDDLKKAVEHAGYKVISIL